MALPAKSDVHHHPSKKPRPLAPAAGPIRQQGDLSLPLYERYQAQLRGRAPFHCVACDRSLARSTLSTHIRNIHGNKRKRGDKHRVDCAICGEKFVGSDLAVEHVTQYHKYGTYTLY